jgi:GNAT superfamily N-acetyltransferase
MEIRSLIPPPWPLLASLIAASCDEGFKFLVRLQDEYISGRVCFDSAGEALFGAFQASRLIGIGGLTRDPYGDEPNTGRIRHLYVLPLWRRHGVGAYLLAEIQRHAQTHFTTLVLRTDTKVGASFYESLGYERLIAGATATHRRNLIGQPLVTRIPVSG